MTDRHEAERRVEVEQALSRMTRKQLVLVAELMGLPLEKIETDFRGPFPKDVLIGNIVEAEIERHRKRWSA